MGLHSLQLVLVGMLFSTIVAAQTQSKPGCLQKCGKISIPFPFGVGDGCYLNPNFNITCNNYYNPPKPFLRSSKFEVSGISVEHGQLSIFRKASRKCYDVANKSNENWYRWFSLAKFDVSGLRNKFTVIGCDSYGYIEGKRNGIPYKAGCITSCNQREYVDITSCSGSGCCHIEIPDGLDEVKVSAYSFQEYSSVSYFSPCTYALIVEEGQFNFSRSHLTDISENRKFPVVLDWSVEDTGGACKGNTIQEKVNGIGGYRCNCTEGYEGNPYLGCQDIDECTRKNECIHDCTNTEGNYTCSCPKWFKGDGRKNGEGCALRTTQIFLITLSVGGIIVVALLVALGLTWL